MSFLNTNLWNQLFSDKYENNKGIDTSDLGYVSKLKKSTNNSQVPDKDADEVKPDTNEVKLNLDTSTKSVYTNESKLKVSSSELTSVDKSEIEPVPSLVNSDVSINQNQSTAVDVSGDVKANQSHSIISEDVKIAAPDTNELDLQDKSINVSPNTLNNSVKEVNNRVKVNTSKDVDTDESLDLVNINDNKTRVNDHLSRVSTNKSPGLFKKISEAMLESKNYDSGVAPNSNYKIVGGSDLDSNGYSAGSLTKEVLNNLENSALNAMSKLIPNQLLNGNGVGGLNISGNLLGNTGNSSTNLLSGSLVTPSIANWDLKTAYLSIKGLKSGDVEQVKPGTNYINLGTNIITDALIRGFNLNELLGTKLSSNHTKKAGVTLIDKNTNKSSNIKFGSDGVIYRGDDKLGSPAYRKLDGSASSTVSTGALKSFNIFARGANKKPFTLFDNSRWAITFTRLGYHTPPVPYMNYFGTTGYQPVTDFSLTTVEQDVDSISYADEYLMNVPSKLKYNFSLQLNIVNDADDTVTDYLRAYRNCMYGSAEFLNNTNQYSSLLGVRSFRKCVTLINIYIYNRQQRLLQSRYGNDFGVNSVDNISRYNKSSNDLPSSSIYGSEDYDRNEDNRLRFFVNYYGLVCIPRLNQESIDGVNRNGSSKNIINIIYDIVGFWNKPSPKVCDLVDESCSYLSHNPLDNVAANALNLSRQFIDNTSNLSGSQSSINASLSSTMIA